MNTAERRGLIQYYGFMPPPVRVIGRIDLTEKVHEALRAAGFDSEIVTAGPMAAYGSAPPAEGIDVVVATSIFDPPRWMFAKARHPLRPMVAVAERRRERALRGALSRRSGPDAYVMWPATPDELAAAIRRAESSASRRRFWAVADLGAALVAVGLPTMAVGGGIGAFVAGVGLLLGLQSAWNARWQAVGGVFLTVLGGVGAAARLAHWFQ
jgi:hypothetical protein